ncbi:MAG: class I fructose-bisphosphate aldolase, partial [Saprospiraceae bacterium]
NLGQYISGAILFDETVRQQTSDGIPFVEAVVKAGIIPGIKVDLGKSDLTNFPGEEVTLGLDDLRERLQEYAGMGLRFAKWRAVIPIGPGLPTDTGIATNMQILARYAALCQEAGLTPIVEPEVLMDGDHSLERCREVTEKVLHGLFEQLYRYRVQLEGLLLKPNMVLAGIDRQEQPKPEAVAAATVNCLLSTVPAAVPGIAFLSGGQSSEVATEHLNLMHRHFRDRLPWALTFSFSRAIQLPALEIWQGEAGNKAAAQTELLARAKANGAARVGEFGLGY